MLAGIVNRMLERPRFPLLQIRLAGENVARFLARAAKPSWRPEFETDLQCIAQDGPGQPLLRGSRW